LRSLGALVEPGGDGEARPAGHQHLVLDTGALKEHHPTRHGYYVECGAPVVLLALNVEETKLTAVLRIPAVVQVEKDSEAASDPILSPRIRIQMPYVACAHRVHRQLCLGAHALKTRVRMFEVCDEQRERLHTACQEREVKREIGEAMQPHQRVATYTAVSVVSHVCGSGRTVASEHGLTFE